MNLRQTIVLSLPRFVTCEFPFYPPLFLNRPGSPGYRSFAQRRYGRDPILSEAFPRKHADLRLSLIQPAGMLGSIVNLEPCPQLCSTLLIKVSSQRLQAVGIEIIHYKMNLSGVGIASTEDPHKLREIRRFPALRDFNKVPTPFGFDGTEGHGRSLPLILIVFPPDSTWFEYAGGWTYILEQLDGLLVEANH